MTQKPNPAFLVLGYLVFFGWNLWFLLWLDLGLAPLVVWEMLVAAWYGMVPWTFAAFAMVLLTIPAAGILVGFHRRLRGDPGRLLSVFYGLQAPLMLLICIRLFAVQQLTWATGLALTVAGFGAIALMRTLWVGGAEPRGSWQIARLVGQTGYLLGGLWCAAVVALYAFSLSAQILGELLQASSWVYFHPAMIPGVLFMVFTAVVLVIFPIAMVGISARAFQLVGRATVARYGPRVTGAIVASTLGFWLAAFSLASFQPQVRVFPALAEATTDEARRELLERSDTVRSGLVYARLAVERTLEGDPDGDHLIQLWRPLVGETLAEVPRAAWKVLFAPFTYHAVNDGWSWTGRGGSAPNDVGLATAAYGDFFDAPIEVAERDVLLRAARQTWSWEDAQAGLLEVGQQKVHLARQETVVVPHGDLATVSVHDVYRNRTWDRQEVLLYFTLPESAAITGLWLGPDEAHRFAYVVAPRGAAQEVYEAQVQQRKDPALLEQVGPRQYRLRAFPVEPRTGRANDVWSITSEGPDLHLWLELVVPVAEDVDGGPYFPLPDTTEARNLFWDEDTVRTLDGAPITVDDWLPGRVAAPGAARASHSAQIGEWWVRAEPAGPVAPAPLGSVVVLVDGTRSMDAHRPQVDRALARLRTASDDLRVYCTVEQKLARCDDYDAAEALMWGSTALETRLEEVVGFTGDAEALVVLTDAGSYSLAAKAEQERSGRAFLGSSATTPLWLVHFGGDPQAYPDLTLDWIQRTGGGVGGSIDEVLVRMSDPSVLDGYRWTVTPADTVAPSAVDPFVSLAARRVVRHLDGVQRSTGLSALDALHRVAVEHHVVTNYSSMLVLVDDLQRKLLEEAEKREDRFQREVIDGQDEAVEVTSAPEPATLLLIGVGGLALAAGGRLRRR